MIHILTLVGKYMYVLYHFKIKGASGSVQMLSRVRFEKWPKCCGYLFLFQNSYGFNNESSVTVNVCMMKYLMNKSNTFRNL